MNEVLFDADGDTATLYEMKQYVRAKELTPFKQFLSPFITTLQEDFVIFNLVLHEARNLEIESEITPAESERYKKEMNDKELLLTVEHIYQVQALLNIKEKQIGTKERLKAWIDVLKRKYAFVVKSNDFKKNLTQ